MNAAPSTLPRLAYTALFVALSGCAVGPDFQRPAAPSAKAYTPVTISTTTSSAPVLMGEAQHFDATANISHEWWKSFQSPQLDALVDRAFKANPTIEAAQAALMQAQEYANAQQGFFYPTVSASYSPSRNKLAGNMGGNSPGVQGNGQVIQTYSNPAGPKYNGPVYYNFHVAQLTVGYVPDVFGLNRRMAESAEAQVETQQLQLEATYITLAANVVAAALQEASLRAQLAASVRIQALNQESLSVLHNQFKLGYVSGMEVAMQESAAAQSEQALIPLRLQLDKTRNLIRALVGNPPDQDIPETFELSDLHLPQTLPLTLPSKIVEQRPDVRAAEAQLHYASAQAGVAIANTLPQFALAAGIGGMAATPGWMFRSGGGFFDLTASVSQTLFDGGTLHARSRAAEQALLQAGAQYRSTVITALQNVADTLYTIQSDADALKAAAQSEQAARTAYELSNKQFQFGQIDLLTRLVAEQNYQLASINLIQAQTNRLGDTATLYQALGGGWWNREQAALTQAATPETATTTAAHGEQSK